MLHFLAMAMAVLMLSPVTIRMTRPAWLDFSTAIGTVSRRGSWMRILDDCTQLVDESGNVVEMTDERRAFVLAAISDMASQGNRTIAMSYTPLPAISCFPEEEPVEKNLIFMGVLDSLAPLQYCVYVSVPGSHTTVLIRFLALLNGYCRFLSGVTPVRMSM